LLLVELAQNSVVLPDVAEVVLDPVKMSCTPLTLLVVAGSAHALGAVAVLANAVSVLALVGSSPATAEPLVVIGVPPTTVVGHDQTVDPLKLKT
jgi:hypothetical protein